MTRNINVILQFACLAFTKPMVVKSVYVGVSGARLSDGFNVKLLILFDRAVPFISSCLAN